MTDDIVIVDSGSTDDTLNIAKQFNANIISTTWDGYGPNKNKGIAVAKYDWILNIDADEAVDEILLTTLQQLPLDNEQEVFEVRFKNFFLDKWIRHGEWGSDKHIRFFNRKHNSWSNAAVHEELKMSPAATITLLNGHILHYTVQSLEEYDKKTVAYAKLNAEKYFAQGKKSSFVGEHISPVFSFINNYFFRLGFLDGKEGLIIAKATARYTRLKYETLRRMWNKNRTMDDRP